MERIEVGAAPRAPACIRGVLWVTTPAEVARIDPVSGRVLSRLSLGETLGHAAEGPDGLVWVTDKQHSRVYRLSPDGHAVVDSFPAGPAAFALARVGGAMWITSFAGSDVRRFEP
jgi:streptogramin lyase